MANDPSSPTLLSRELGARLKQLRTNANLTISQVAERMLCAESTISRIENGRRRPSERDIRDLCLIYGVDRKTRDQLSQLRAAAREPGWWQQYDVPYKTFIGLEQAASSIRNYETSFVPGLLQTDEYARVTLRNLRLLIPAEAEDPIDNRVAARMNRQEILRRTTPAPPTLHAVIDEMVLRRHVGDAELMRHQAEALIAAAELPHVTVQVIPITIGIHPGLEASTFMYFEFPSKLVSDVAYVEGLIGNLYLEREADTDRYRHAFDHLSQIALDPDDSVRLFHRIAKELRGEA